VELSEQSIRDAEERMTQLLASGPHAVAARYDRRVSRIVVSLSNGLEMAFPPHLAEELADAKPADLAIVEVTPAGLGLHWPRLDAHLYVPALLQGVFGSPGWMAALWNGDGGLARETPMGTRRIKRRRDKRASKAAAAE
jgi:hypothetical protein